MRTISIQYYPTRIGELILGDHEGCLCLLDYRYRKLRARVDDRIKNGLQACFRESDTQLLKTTRKQLDEYLDGTKKQFDLPLLMIGSAFQKKVWTALMAIPYGATTSYFELARSIGNEKAVRAVAGANGANAMSLVIPCHRVIGSNGELVGYGGGLAVKRKLLHLEQVSQQLSLDF